jgi:4-hydroxybenzoyl-CoA reductase subunit beta
MDGSEGEDLMIRLAPFELHSPATLCDAAVLLAQANGEAEILAGGTDLVPGMKQGTVRPTTVVWLGKIPELTQISFTKDRGATIGAMCTLSEIEQHKDIQQYYPSLIQAVRSIASLQIRNRATIGGNLCLDTRCFYYDQSEFWRGSLGFCLKYGNGTCHAAPELRRCTAVFCSDLAPLLVALNSTIELYSSASQKTLPLTEFYQNDGMHHLGARPAELLTKIFIPYSPATRAAHGKMRSRASIDFAIANVGIALSVKSDRCENIRIIVGAIASAPIDASEMAKESLGQKLTDERIREIAEKVSSLVHPLPHTDSAVGYRKKMVAVLVRRVLSGLQG